MPPQEGAIQLLRRTSTDRSARPSMYQALWLKTSPSAPSPCSVPPSLPEILITGLIYSRNGAKSWVCNGKQSRWRERLSLHHPRPWVLASLKATQTALATTSVWPLRYMKTVTGFFQAPVERKPLVSLLIPYSRVAIYFMDQTRTLLRVSEGALDNDTELASAHQECPWLTATCGHLTGHGFQVLPYSGYSLLDVF